MKKYYLDLQGRYRLSNLASDESKASITQGFYSSYTQTEFDKLKDVEVTPEYVIKRLSEYRSFDELKDLELDGDTKGVAEWKAHRASVKAKYPKK